jgi:hypothetical protein
VWLIDGGRDGRELAVGKLLSPKLPRMLAEGMVPRPPPVAPAGGGEEAVSARVVTRRPGVFLRPPTG